MGMTMSDVEAKHVCFMLHLYSIKVVLNICESCDTLPISFRFKLSSCLRDNLLKEEKYSLTKFVFAKDGLIYFDCLKKSKGEVNLEENSNLVEKRRFKNKDENVTSNQKGKSNMMPQSASNEKKNENKVSIPKVYTANGKEKAPCDRCGRFYEKKMGLRVHKRFCHEA